MNNKRGVRFFPDGTAEVMGNSVIAPALLNSEFVPPRSWEAGLPKSPLLQQTAVAGDRSNELEKLQRDRDLIWTDED